MRELIEQDHREKMNCLRRENSDMIQVVAQYEKTIVELTGMLRYLDNKKQGNGIVYQIDIIRILDQCFFFILNPLK